VGYSTRLWVNRFTRWRDPSTCNLTFCSEILSILRGSWRFLEILGDSWRFSKWGFFGSCAFWDTQHFHSLKEKGKERREKQIITVIIIRKHNNIYPGRVLGQLRILRGFLAHWSGNCGHCASKIHHSKWLHRTSAPNWGKTSGFASSSRRKVKVLTAKFQRHRLQIYGNSFLWLCIKSVPCPPMSRRQINMTHELCWGSSGFHPSLHLLLLSVETKRKTNKCFQYSL